MKRIGIFTSGGDAPGMNACIRAAVRYGIAKGLQVFGIKRGYQGMIDGDIIPMDRASVSGIIGRGGTVLGTDRCPKFATPEGRKQALENLKQYEIEGLVACGGNGTFQGATVFFEEHGVPVIGTPGTIDNDLYGTDFTIGYDTAVNIAMEAVDRLRDTAESHGRTFFVEVMGRHAGFIALDVGAAVGAEYVAVPEIVTNFEDLCRYVGGVNQEKRHIFIISEGDDYGGAFKFAEDFKKRFNIEARVAILGHIQRGGAPTARDRILATRLGAAAVQALLDGKSCMMAGEINGEVVLTSMREAWEKKAEIDRGLLELVEIIR
ncbi:MAG: 6-phosphofructokinase [Chlorobi bacterium]|nr:MAG: phosphofructokinase [Chlorobi bacterium OLB7]MBK8911893.1 6-phosphofructokinase [Chlorobiota bacterium]MBX7215466.1 6-phosphofructokinase [Candidatus Kapabacteria bacterium]